MVGFLRMKSSVVTAFVVVMLFCSSIWGFAQPLVPGVSLEGERYFLDDGELKVRRMDGSLETRSPGSIGDIEKLLQPDGWDETILVVGTEGFTMLGFQDEEVFDTTPSGQTKGSELKSEFYLWGNKAAWRVEGENAVQWTMPGHSGRVVESDEIVGEPTVFGDRLLFLTKTGHYRLLSSESPDDVKSEKLPFPVEEAQITTSGDQALIWSLNSAEVVNPVLGETIPLPRLPAYGSQVVTGGGILLGLPRTLVYFDPSGTHGVLNSPIIFSKESFQKGRFFTHGQTVFSLGKNGQDLLFQALAPGSSGLVLQSQEVKAVVLPPNNPPMLLTETSFDEARVHHNGKVVVNPKTNEVFQHSVKGFELHRLGQGSTWTEIKAQPRSKIVGPAHRIGDNLIFATQTEPAHQEGVDRSVDGRYPYPKVLIHAISLQTGEESWSLDVPRGEAPSLARLPDGAQWPLMGADGPLLFTTEDDRLAGLDLTNGQVAWLSGSLPLDESRPKMIVWQGGLGLGLVAVKNTTKKFLLFDDQGKIVESIRLNDLFNHARTLNLIGVIVICLALILYIYLAGKKKLFIRRIAGLEALDEAVGRSTEMGKPVLYVTGLADVDDIQTLAALSILSHVAKKTAEYDTPILTTTSRAVTFSAAQEVVRDAFTIAGRPDSFSVESVRYISDDQFGYAAGVDGLMVREKPAANFYMGKFYAESLIFAETGNATGAIQIAGTAQANQLPFFVAACDYTLIGEELFAASAYLSGDPLQVGSLRGQDVGKAIVMVILVVLSIDASFEGRLTAWLAGLIGGGA
jgi:hypothetical protein